MSAMLRPTCSHSTFTHPPTHPQLRSPDGSRLKISLKAQQLESEWPGADGTGGTAVAKQTTTWRRVHA